MRGGKELRNLLSKKRQEIQSSSVVFLFVFSTERESERKNVCLEMVKMIMMDDDNYDDDDFMHSSFLSSLFSPLLSL